jgi:hypothetical protein
MAYVVWHVQDSNGQPLADVFVSGASSTMGTWSARTNACGDAKTTLGAATYAMTFEAPGFTTRTYPATIGDSGEIITGLERSAATLPFPPPTRDEALAIRVGFQGETVTTSEYGTFPAFGPETTTLNDDDLHAYCSQLAARGWTHGEIAISWAYSEPNFLMPVPGRDLTQDLPELARRIVIMLQHFKAVCVFLAGDGMSAQPNPDGSYPYNDPIGHTYGYEWLGQAFPHIGAYLQSGNPYGDLTKYCVFVPGYDGVFYGWGIPGEVPDQQPDRVVHFGQLFRQVLPDGYLGIEHSTGKIPVGEGGSDWNINGRMMVYDAVLSEFEWPTTGNQVWQIVARLTHPYNRPPDQPAGDDPNPPFYLAHNNPRGPVYYCAYEYATFQWTRGQVTAEQVQQSRDYFAVMGCRSVC